MNGLSREDKLRLRRETMAAYPGADRTILIEIPAGRDPELLNTVHSALVQADVPDRVHFAVCHQDDDMAVIEKLKGVKHMAVAHVPLSEARGTCYARWWCQELYDGEDFAFHVDSHMRFIKHWDTQLIRQWNECHDPKAVISFYCAAVDHGHLGLKLDDPVFDKPGVGGRIVIERMEPWSLRTFFRQKLYLGGPTGQDIRDRTPFVSGHYLFGPGGMSREVRMDPYMWYQGDELAYGIRLYTFGYNAYTSELSWVRHVYARKGRFVPEMGDRRKKEHERLRNMLGMERTVDLGEYGPGPVRTVQEYQDFAGVDFATCTIQERAKEGVYGLDFKTEGGTEDA